MLLRQNNCKLIVYPGAFNMVTGPAHWELLQRGRAVDNQLFVAACSPARNENSGGYVAWGHSSIVNPWGNVIAKAESKEEIIYGTHSLTGLLTHSLTYSLTHSHSLSLTHSLTLTHSPTHSLTHSLTHSPTYLLGTLNMQEVDEMRDGIPCWKQKRHDIYELQKKI